MKQIKQKPTKKTKNLIQRALELHKAGNLKQAEHLFNEILTLHPRNAQVHYYLATISQDQGNFDDAIKGYQRVIELNPDFAGSYYNLGSIFHERNQLDEAMHYYQKAVLLDPGHADTFNTLGVIFKDKKRYDDAIYHFNRAIRLDPNFALPYNNLGLIYEGKKLFDEAIRYFEKALQINPDYARAYYNLGNVLQEKGQLDQAIACYQKVVEITPDFLDVYQRLGTALQKKGDIDQAIVYYRRALLLKPDLVGAYVDIGRAYMHQRKFDEAESTFRQALEINSNTPSCYSNLLFLMLYSSQYDAQTIFLEHLKFAEHCANPLIGSVFSHTSNRSPNRRLKVGYVSPDFRDHSVSYFIEPVLLAHNRKYFEIYCYSEVSHPDKVTEHIQGLADQWRDIVGMSVDQAAELIRKDEIDILVDLAGHTSWRILTFARKPAPIQINWIGYPATTGLSTMDYKIVDNYTDPLGLTENFYTEKLIRLPESFLCYLPVQDSPDIGPVPQLSLGHITFGSFNNVAKMSAHVFEVWSRILKAIPGSRLAIKLWQYSDKKSHQFIVDMFAKEGTDSERILMLPWEASARNHLSLYSRIDIGLDTFPYHGTTTTCEALWMGVPVITLAGDTHVSRVGVSILSNVGLADLIASTHDDYIAIAVTLANDLKRLQSLRANLRTSMMRSPLTNTRRFTMDLEKHYREIWQHWCRNE